MWMSLFVAEKFDEWLPQTKKGLLIWKFAMSAVALIQIVYNNDETRDFFSQIIFAFCSKEIYKHILSWLLN